MSSTSDGMISQLKFNSDGLIPAVVQDHKDGTVLMVAYMNRESFRKTLESGVATFWSRSRKKLWIKGETSGNVQKVKAILADCDKDTLVLRVDQVGGAACHTGNRSCFHFESDGKKWVEKSKPLFDPKKVYQK